jgi:hypothetical protein
MTLKEEKRSKRAKAFASARCILFHSFLDKLFKLIIHYFLPACASNQLGL